MVTCKNKGQCILHQFPEVSKIFTFFKQYLSILLEGTFCEPSFIAMAVIVGWLTRQKHVQDDACALGYVPSGNF